MAIIKFQSDWKGPYRDELQDILLEKHPRIYIRALAGPDETGIDPFNVDDDEMEIILERLKEVLPRQQFKLPIQAAIGGKIIARETVPAYRKDVTGGLYGGDRTRKDKLLKKQKKGKKRLKQFGKVDIPQSAFLEALKTSENSK